MCAYLTFVLLSND
ncbi:acridine resistance protein [Escherichia phage T2]|nr:Ac acridine resistance protein [Escherichia phage T2]AYD82852.1 acridine resistance protein [Escherichia phage T2]BBC14879.1 Ac acridine resistance protein [Escherichia phage T2]